MLLYLLNLLFLQTRLEEKKDPEPVAQEDQNQTPVIDTTDQHRAHLFDLNCKVCTGKIVPGPEEQAAAAAAAAKVWKKNTLIISIIKLTFVVGGEKIHL